jgi:undecaprenyl diphosphate synthase
LCEAIEKTKDNTGVNLILALNYSARWEIIEAVKQIAAKVKSEDLSIDAINAELFDLNLTTAVFPDPEFLIRTSGEHRISNFLLWQIAYTEFHFTSTLWPDFKEEDLYKAVLDYQSRERRFGMVSEQITK